MTSSVGIVGSLDDAQNGGAAHEIPLADNTSSRHRLHPCHDAGLLGGLSIAVVHGCRCLDFVLVHPAPFTQGGFVGGDGLGLDGGDGILRGPSPLDVPELEQPLPRFGHGNPSTVTTYSPRRNGSGTRSPCASRWPGYQPGS